MKSISLSTKFLCVLALCSFAYVASAQTNSSQDRQTTVPENKIERSELRASSSAARQEVQIERRAALETRAQQRVTNLAGNMSVRIEAAIARMDNLIARIESRTQKLKERGVETAPAESYITDAKASLEEAKTSIADIYDAVAEVTESENPREAWASVKATFTHVKDLLLSVHSSLRKAVVSLKLAVADTELEQGRSAAVTTQVREELTSQGTTATE